MKIERTVDGSYICPVCGWIYKTYHWLKRHVREQHAMNYTFTSLEDFT